MKIVITKTTFHQSTYTITRNNLSQEKFELDTKTFLLHDITHFVVEQQLGYTNGFWGMLAAGHSFAVLFGKDNELTEKLRFIEKIVGPVQSVYSGHIPANEFPMYIEYLGLELNNMFLETCLTELTQMMASWERLLVGESFSFEWK